MPIFLDRHAVAEYVSLPGSAIEQLMRRGAFPQPHLVSGHRLLWFTREVDKWCETQSVLSPEVTEVPVDGDWNAAVADDGACRVLQAGNPPQCGDVRTSAATQSPSAGQAA